jgi:hypothetical protein
VHLTDLGAQSVAPYLSEALLELMAHGN